LRGWDGLKNFSEFRRLIDDISTVLGSTPIATAESEDRHKDQEMSNLWPTYGPVPAAVAVVLVLFSFVFWPKPQGTAEKIIVLVADFNGPDPKNNRVTDTVINHLNRVTKKYDDIEIQGLEKAITEKEGSKVAQY
jgi:hypothetical protein